MDLRSVSVYTVLLALLAAVLPALAAVVPPQIQEGVDLPGNPGAVDLDDVRGTVHVTLPGRGTLLQIGGPPLVVRREIALGFVPTDVAVDSLRGLVYVSGIDDDDAPGTGVLVLDALTGGERGAIHFLDEPRALLANELTDRLHVATRDRLYTLDADSGDTLGVAGFNARFGLTLALSELTNRIYVTGFRSLTLPPSALFARVDAASGELIDTVFLGTGQAGSLAVDPSTETVFATRSSLEGRVAIHVFGGRTMSEITAFAPRPLPVAGRMAVDPRARRLYLLQSSPSGDEAYVAIFDVDTEWPVHAVPVEGQPIDLAVEPGAGRAHVVTRGPARLYLLGSPDPGDLLQHPVDGTTSFGAARAWPAGSGFRSPGTRPPAPASRDPR